MASSQEGTSLAELSSGKARDHDVTMSYAQRKRYRSWAKAVARSLARAMEKNHRTLANWFGPVRRVDFGAQALDHCRALALKSSTVPVGAP